MKMTMTVIAVVAFAAGLAAALIGGNLISKANAAGDTVILITSDAEIATKCNFDKTVVRAYNSYACVRR